MSGGEHFWSVPRMFEGRTVFVVGGGPSINDMDLSPIHEHPVVGINNAFELGEWVDMIYFMDCRWFEDNEESLRQYGGLKITTCKRLARYDHPGLRVLLCKKHEGVDPDPRQLMVYQHSGTGAINLAVHLGAARIVLLGFDMQKRDGRHNWHTKHRKSIKPELYKDRFEPALRSMAKPLKDMGIEVVNATPGSALEVWPKVDLRENAGYAAS